MKWRNARRSQNVEDARTGGGGGSGSRRTARRFGGGAAKKGGLGIGAIVMALVAIFVFNKSPMEAIGGLLGGGSSVSVPGGGGVLDWINDKMSGDSSALDPSLGAEDLTPAELEQREMIAHVLGSTEDVWKELYPRLANSGLTKGNRVPRSYVEPRLQIFRDSARTQGCGLQSSAVGPFYCPADNRIYIDVGFFQTLSKQLGARGDFAPAYVIGHEVGHHIQNLLGINRWVAEQRNSLSEKENNQLSVRLELQADYFAGVWARKAEDSVDLLESGDFQEAMKAAAAVGDDTLQKRSRGTVMPDSFTHGTAEQRQRWFKRGFESGDPLAWDPFAVSYRNL